MVISSYRRGSSAGGDASLPSHAFVLVMIMPLAAASASAAVRSLCTVRYGMILFSKKSMIEFSAVQCSVKL